jgi:hypothetical protein
MLKYWSILVKLRLISFFLSLSLSLSVCVKGHVVTLSTNDELVIIQRC